MQRAKVEYIQTPIRTALALEYLIMDMYVGVDIYQAKQAAGYITYTDRLNANCLSGHDRITILRLIGYSIKRVFNKAGKLTNIGKLELGEITMDDIKPEDVWDNPNFKVTWIKDNV
jgi:hypothetical protein